MSIHRTIALVVLPALLLLLCGCPRLLPPPHPLVQKMNELPPGVQEPVQGAVWAHGNPYNWSRAENLVMDVIWTEYQPGLEPQRQARRYVIDFKEDSMRVDLPQEGAGALMRRGRVISYDQLRQANAGANEEVAILRDAVPRGDGQRMLRPSPGDMRLMRTLYSMPFMLLEPGVELEAAGVVESRGGGRQWQAVRAMFDPAATGHIRGDRMLVHFDSSLELIDRILLLVSGQPFNRDPHWADFSQYRQVGELLLPHRIEFRATDRRGAEDLGLRLTVEVERASLNVPLPENIFTDPQIVTPAPRQADEEPLEVRRIGRDAITP